MQSYCLVWVQVIRLSEKVRLAVQQDEFEQDLLLRIMSLSVRTILIMSLVDRSVPFIQFGGIDVFDTRWFAGDDTDMVTEFPGENGRRDMAALTGQQQGEFKPLGFEPSGEGAPAWGRNLTWPTPIKTIKEIVCACAIRFRDIGGIQSPDQPRYKIWRCPEKPREGDDHFYEKLNPDDDDPRLSEPGIPHERGRPPA